MRALQFSVVFVVATFLLRGGHEVYTNNPVAAGFIGIGAALVVTLAIEKVRGLLLRRRHSCALPIARQ